MGSILCHSYVAEGKSVYEMNNFTSKANCIEQASSCVQYKCLCPFVLGLYFFTAFVLFLNDNSDIAYTVV
jgi:hypothetical protein